jgi:hypothetical protein
MMRWLSSLLLILCLWNSTAAAMPSFGGFVEDTHISSVSQTSESAAVALASADCPSGDAHHDHCELHRCHLGHCTFLPALTDRLDSPFMLLSRFVLDDHSAYGISLSGPRKPPRA